MNARQAFLQGEEESGLWKDVTHELMSDEEDLDDKLKVKSPTWRTNSLTQLIRKLDERRDAERLSGAKQGIRLKRVAAESPMKRKPSKKVKRRFINEENLYEEREDNDDEGDDN